MLKKTKHLPILKLYSHLKRTCFNAEHSPHTYCCFLEEILKHGFQIFVFLVLITYLSDGQCNHYQQYRCCIFGWNSSNSLNFRCFKNTDDSDCIRSDSDCICWDIYKIMPSECKYIAPKLRSDSDFEQVDTNPDFSDVWHSASFIWPLPAWSWLSQHFYSVVFWIALKSVDYWS